MKKFYLILIALFITFSSFSSPDCDNCPERFRFGFVKIVETRGEADVVVYIDDNRMTSDLVLVVKKIDYIPSHCGEWHFTDCGENFRIYIDDNRMTADLVIFFEDN